MLSYSRRFVLFAIPAVLAGCGFSPAFAPGGAATRLQNSILLDEPKGREGYLFNRHFEDRLGRGIPGRYGLSYAIALSEDPIAIAENNVITRYNLLGSVKFALRDMDSKAVLVSGQVDNFTSYSASGTTVATQAAQRDAEARLMVILADQIINKLTAEAGKLPA